MPEKPTAPKDMNLPLKTRDITIRRGQMAGRAWLVQESEAQKTERPKSEFQQLSEQIAALADGLRVRHEQSTAQFLALGKRINDAESAISEQVQQGFVALEHILSDIRSPRISERLAAIEEKLGKIRCGNRIGQSKTFCDQTLGHRGFCSAFVVARRKKKGKR